MRRALLLSAVFGMALLSGAARGQTAARAPTAAATPAVVLQQQQEAVAARTAYLLEVYASQSGGPASPEMQAEISRRATEYFTNGAQATGVPMAGPAAAYFSNGAAVTTVPTSVIPDFTFAPPAIASPSIPSAPPDAGAVRPEDSGAPQPARTPIPAPEAGATPADTSSANAPREAPPAATESQETAPPTPVGLDTAAARPTATASATPAATPTASTTVAPVTPPAAAIAVQATPPPLTTPASSVLWVMLGGVGLGGALVLLGVGVGRRGRRSRST